ncbi:hypothetical protein [Paenibacillus taihuensis]|uniref:hypothetical protein n=1 Tax=Paenibacillus taihuensis TaxID=1156355 RepID=UPI001FE79A48|nr:hypothetical protein [Paenibacillus taihuensis]
MLWRSYQYGDENKSDDAEEVVEFDDSDVNSGAPDDSVDTEQPTDNDGQGYSITVKVVDANGNAVNTGRFPDFAPNSYEYRWLLAGDGCKR